MSAGRVLDKWYFFGIIAPATGCSMTSRQTEQRDPLSANLDLLDDHEVLGLLARGQASAASSVSSAIPAIGTAAEIVSETLRGGGRLVYAAAGSSGLMALADALELPGTFGIANEQIVVLFAGGATALMDMKGGPEDDANAGRQEVEALNLSRLDCLIAVTASGRTPYPLAAVTAAKAAGARTIGIANNADATLFEMVDVAICLPTPPEVIAGSTRMGAGTAQKIALNMLSTLAAMRLGHVHDGYMVNVVADNEKLQDRARDIVARIAQVDAERANLALGATFGAVKPAVLVAAGVSPARAMALLEQHDGHLRPALAEITG